MNCIFCKIAHHETPANIVYEDENFLAFLDINPVRKGHLLLIPKDHYPWMQDLPDALLSESFILVKKLMVALKQALSADYIQVSVVGKDVPHFHIHLMPRNFDDGLHGWPTRTYEGTEMETITEKIKSAL